MSDDKNAVLIVGYQAPHTLGRRLVEGRREVKIFGVEVPRRAEVVVLNGFSAHADQKDLIEYARDVRDKGQVKDVVLVHGDPKPQKVLKGLLQDEGFDRVAMPGPGDRIDF